MRRVPNLTAKRTDIVTQVTTSQLALPIPPLEHFDDGESLDGIEAQRLFNGHDFTRPLIGHFEALYAA